MQRLGRTTLNWHLIGIMTGGKGRLSETNPEEETNPAGMDTGGVKNHQSAYTFAVDALDRFLHAMQLRTFARGTGDGENSLSLGIDIGRTAVLAAGLWF